MKAVLFRQSNLSNDKQTLGRFILLNENGEVVFTAVSLELPWRNNMPNISCVLTGTYPVKKVNSGKFGRGTFSLFGVFRRTYIRIHPASFVDDLLGCIALGERFKDLDKDGLKDVVNSKATIDRLKKLADEFELTIIQI